MVQLGFYIYGISYNYLLFDQQTDVVFWGLTCVLPTVFAATVLQTEHATSPSEILGQDSC
jgi:hypothetical protein